LAPLVAADSLFIRVVTIVKRRIPTKIQTPSHQKSSQAQNPQDASTGHRRFDSETQPLGSLDHTKSQRPRSSFGELMNLAGVSTTVRLAARRDWQPGLHLQPAAIQPMEMSSGTSHTSKQRTHTAFGHESNLGWGPC
jgi:hypothetical protein